MIETTGHVTVNERTPSDRFHRFVDEKIKDWLGERSLSEGAVEYEVAFFDEEPLGETSCLIVVQSGDQLWRAWETADEPRAALQLSLERLKVEGSVSADDDIVHTDALTH